MSRLTIDRPLGLESRALPKVKEPLQHHLERRAADRRDSPRVPMQMFVRYADESASFEPREGNVGLGGAYWKGPYQPPGATVHVAFWLPETGTEVRCTGRVVRSSQIGAQVGVHVQFDELPVRTELALARYLQRWLMSH